MTEGPLHQLVAAMNSGIDAVVTAFDPQAAAERAIARRKIEIINSGYGDHGANRYKKNTIGRLDNGGSSREDIEENLNLLRIRSRDNYMGTPVATAAVNTKRINVIGSGIMPTPLVDADFLGLSTDEANELQAQIVREFDMWADTPSCDADRIDNFYQLQQLAFMGYLLNGDAFAVLDENENDMSQPYRLALRLIEADRVCSPDYHDVLAPTTVRGAAVERIVQGIETDARGTIKAYWISTKHPLSDEVYLGSKTQEWNRVAAYSEDTGRKLVMHVMRRERAGQLRGVPMLAPVLEELNQLGRYSQAELDAAVVASLSTGFITKESPTNAQPYGEIVPPNIQIDREDKGSIELAPAAIFDLNPGEKVEFPQPGRPNANFTAFYDAVLEQISAAMGIPVEVLNKKFSTSYSAARGALNEFWRECETERDAFNNKFNQPIYEEWFAEAVALGRIHAPGFFNDPAIRRAYTNCRWNGPARTNLSPKDEAEAAIMRVQAGFSTAEEETAQMTGGSYASNIKQRRIEAQMQREVDEIAGDVQAQTQVQQSSGGAKPADK